MITLNQTIIFFTCSNCVMNCFNVSSWRMETETENSAQSFSTVKTFFPHYTILSKHVFLPLRLLISCRQIPEQCTHNYQDNEDAALANMRNNTLSCPCKANIDGLVFGKEWEYSQVHPTRSKVCSDCRSIGVHFIHYRIFRKIYILILLYNLHC